MIAELDCTKKGS